MSERSISLAASLSSRRPSSARRRARVSREAAARARRLPSSAGECHRGCVRDDDRLADGGGLVDRCPNQRAQHLVGRAAGDQVDLQSRAARAATFCLGQLLRRKSLLLCGREKDLLVHVPVAERVGNAAGARPLHPAHPSIGRCRRPRPARANAVRGVAGWGSRVSVSVPACRTLAWDAHANVGIRQGSDVAIASLGRA